MMNPTTVYRVKCSDCLDSYISKTGRNLNCWCLWLHHCTSSTDKPHWLGLFSMLAVQTVPDDLGVKLTFFPGSHLAPRYFKFVANSWTLVAIMFIMTKNIFHLDTVLDRFKLLLNNTVIKNYSGSTSWNILTNLKHLFHVQYLAITLLKIDIN